MADIYKGLLEFFAVLVGVVVIVAVAISLFRFIMDPSRQVIEFCNEPISKVSAYSESAFGVAAVCSDGRQIKVNK